MTSIVAGRVCRRAIKVGYRRRCLHSGQWTHLSSRRLSSNSLKRMELHTAKVLHSKSTIMKNKLTNEWKLRNEWRLSHCELLKSVSYMYHIYKLKSVSHLLRMSTGKFTTIYVQFKLTQNLICWRSWWHQLATCHCQYQVQPIRNGN